MRVQRTRSSASPPHSPLTRWPLGGLRAVEVALGILMALAIPRVTVAAESADTFDAFLKRFVADNRFRLQRTTYPLAAHLGNACEEDWKTEKWPRSRVEKENLKPLSVAELAANGLSQEIKKISATRIEVFQFRDEADSYLVTYRFELKKGSWVLAWFEEGSC